MEQEIKPSLRPSPGKRTPTVRVYTSITAGKDYYRTDIQTLNGYDRFVNPVLNAKIYKVLAHKFIDTDISIWLDGNIFLNVPAEQLVEEWLGDADIALFRHNHRHNIYQEAERTKGIFKNRTPWVRDDIDRQMAHYRQLGIPPLKAYMCGMIIRRHSKEMERFNEAWWAEICRWSQRDQLSFPVVIRDFDFKINRINGNIKDHPYLRYETHAHFKT